MKLEMRTIKTKRSQGPNELCYSVPGKQKEHHDAIYSSELKADNQKRSRSKTKEEFLLSFFTTSGVMDLRWAEDYHFKQTQYPVGSPWSDSN